MNVKTQKKIYLAIVLAMVMSLIPSGGYRKAHAVQYQFNDASLELSDSNPGSVANWVITIETVQAITPDDTITITPEATYFSIPADMDEDDMDLELDDVDQPLDAAAGSGAGTAWGVAVTSGDSGNIVLTNNDTDTVAAGTKIEIEIGTNATYDSTTGEEQITNPSKVAAVGTADIREVDITSSNGSTLDTIDLLVAIIEDIDIYASQQPQMTMTIAGQTAPSGGAIAANYIEWREITPGTPKVAQLRVTLQTDAKDGFTVYIFQNNNMQHSEDSGIDIDGVSGSNASPAAWASPAGTTIGVNTGYLGYHTSDISLGTGTADRFVNADYSTADRWAALQNGWANEMEILYHDEATQSAAPVDGQDRADVTFQLETNNLQPSGNYSNEITFVAVPIF